MALAWALRSNDCLENHYNMLVSDLKIALRSLLKNKVFSVINIAGLAIGISASLVIFLIVNQEFSYEKNWKGASNTYRVVSAMHFPNQLFPNPGAPGPLGKVSSEMGFDGCMVSILFMATLAPLPR